MNIRLALALLMVVICGPASRAQQPQQPEAPPVFRVQVDAVEIDAFVTDAQGNPVTDLTADDFEILEDRAPQTITSFALVNIPIERVERPLFSPTAIEPDVHTNDRAEGRIYLFAIDEVSPALVPRTRLFLRRFIEQHFAANDLAALVYIGRGRSGDTQDFTSNRRLLLNAVDKVSGGFSDQVSVPTGANLEGQIGASGDPARAEAEYHLRSRMKSLRALTEFMAGMKDRRKTMLYFTTSLGADVFNALDYTGGTRSIAIEDLHGAITAATRGNVSIYPVDPAGLTPTGDVTDDAAPASDPAASLGRLQDLRALAEATGGFAVVNTNSFDAAFTRIVLENSTYYVLGFSSTNERRDGRFRKVEVRVRRPGLIVRARDGYLAPIGRAPVTTAARSAEALPAAVAESLASPMANPAVPMKVFAASYKGDDRQANVVIALEMDTLALDLVEKDGTFVGEITVATTAIAAGGKVHPGQRHLARLALRPETYERAKAAGLRVLSEFKLPPGRYQLRVAGGTATGRAGSVMYDLEVADFTKGPLVMSGVSLTSDSAQAAPTVRPVDPLAGIMPGPITAAREFRSGDTLALYMEVYENLRNAARHTVDLKVELRTDDGRVVSTTAEERSSTELGGKPGGYGFLAQVPLTGIDAGLYVIHAEARSNMGARPTVSRDIQIRVR